MKVRVRQKIDPLIVEAGDTVELIHKQNAVDANGNIIYTVSEKSVLKEKIDRNMVLDEAVIFDIEKGDFEGAVDGIGGAYLQTKKKA